MIDYVFRYSQMEQLLLLCICKLVVALLIDGSICCLNLAATGEDVQEDREACFVCCFNWNLRWFRESR